MDGIIKTVTGGESDNNDNGDIDNIKRQQVRVAMLLYAVKVTVDTV